MAIPGSTTQPQQVSQAFIPPAAAAHGDEAWLVPEEDRIAVVTRAIPPRSFSIQSNSANPIHLTPSNTTADQHTSMGTSNQSMSDHPLTSPLHPQSMLGNPGDQSMSDPLLISSHCYSILSDPGDQLSLHQQDPQVTDQSNIWSDFNLPDDFPLYIHFGAETNDSFPLSDLDLPEGIKSDVDATRIPFSPMDPHPTEGIPSSYPAADAKAGGEIGQAVSGSLGGDLTTLVGGLPVGVGVGDDQLPLGHVSRVLQMEVLEDQEEEGALLIRSICLIRAGMRSLWNDVFVSPHEPPTSRQGRYITKFDPRLEGDKPKNGRRSHSHWNETDVKTIHDPSAPGNIIGLRRTLEYMNGSKRTHWRANEYVAVEALGGDALQIQEEIAVRTVYEEEDSETAPPTKCSKNCPHCHSSGGSYVWKDMTKVFVKGDSETAPFLLYAICRRCDNGKVLKCPPNYGTKNLNTHLGNVHGIRPPCRSQQVMSKKGRGAVGGSVLSAHQGGVCVE